jgi:hypothetical protein
LHEQTAELFIIVYENDSFFAGFAGLQVCRLQTMRLRFCLELKWQQHPGKL